MAARAARSAAAAASAMDEPAPMELDGADGAGDGGAAAAPRRPPPAAAAADAAAADDIDAADGAAADANDDANDDDEEGAAGGRARAAADADADVAEYGGEEDDRDGGEDGSDGGEAEGSDPEEAARAHAAREQRAGRLLQKLKQKEELFKKRNQHREWYAAVTVKFADPRNKAALTNPTSNKASRAINILNEKFNELDGGDMDSTLADSTLMGTLGRYGAKAAQALTQVVRIDVDDMLTQFRRRFGARDDDAGGAVDWHRFGTAVSCRFRSIECASFMKGLLGLQPVVREAKKRAQRRAPEEPDAPLEHGSHLSSARLEAESMTDARVKALYANLPHGSRDDAELLYTCLYHPTSFTQTVENLFDLTFLVKRNKAEIFLDPELCLPMVRSLGRDASGRMPDEAPAAADGDGDGATFQFIDRIDMDTWRRAVKLFNPDGRPSRIKDRTAQYQAVEREADAAAAAAQQRGEAPAAARAAASSSAHAQRSRKRNALDDVPDLASPSQRTMPAAFGNKRRRSNQTDDPIPQAASAAAAASGAAEDDDMRVKDEVLDDAASEGAGSEVEY